MRKMTICKQSLYVPNTSTFLDHAQMTVSCTHNHELMSYENFAAEARLGASLGLIYYDLNWSLVWISLSGTCVQMVKTLAS